MAVGWILTIAVLISILSLGFIIYLGDPKNRTNKLFAIMVFWISAWMVSNFLENELLFKPELAKLFLRIDFSSAAVLVYFWVLFCWNFPKWDENLSKTKQIILFIPSIIFVLLSFTDLLIYSINFSESIINFEFGKLYILYVIYILGYTLIGGCGNLVKKYKKTSGIERRQIFYVLLGLIISALITTIINLFFQQILPVEVFRIGIYSFIFLVGFTSYAILKHHLFNIKIIATEIFTFFVSITLLVNALFAKTILEGALKGSLFIATTFFSYLLIKSVLKEVVQREKLAKLTITLQKANSELRQLDDAKTEFISIASHQLRTPLTAIKGYISMMTEGDYGEFTGEQMDILRKLYASNQRLICLVENLLDISRMEQGRMNYLFENINIEDLARDVVDELVETAKIKNLDLRFVKTKSAVSKIVADEQKIRQVFMNLVDNAIKYTEKGSIEVKLEKKKDSVLFSVKDTGLGVKPEDKGKLFKRFSRGSSMPKLHVNGSGLGLYVVLKVTEAHHGKVWVESAGEGKGSTFFVSLPVG